MGGLCFFRCNPPLAATSMHYQRVSRSLGLALVIVVQVEARDEAHHLCAARGFPREARD